MNKTHPILRTVPCFSFGEIFPHEYSVTEHSPGKYLVSSSEFGGTRCVLVSSATQAETLSGHDLDDRTAARVRVAAKRAYRLAYKQDKSCKLRAGRQMGAE